MSMNTTITPPKPSGELVTRSLKLHLTLLGLIPLFLILAMTPLIISVIAPTNSGESPIAPLEAKNSFYRVVSETEALILSVENLTLKSSILRNPINQDELKNIWERVRANITLLEKTLGQNSPSPALKNASQNLALSSGQVIAFPSAKNIAEQTSKALQDRHKFSLELRRAEAFFETNFKSRDRAERRSHDEQTMQSLALFSGMTVFALFMAFFLVTTLMKKITALSQAMREMRCLSTEAQTMGRLSQDLADQLTKHSGQLSLFTGELSKQLALEQLSLDKCVTAMENLKEQFQRQDRTLQSADLVLQEVTEKLLSLEKGFTNLLEVFSERLTEYLVISSEPGLVHGPNESNDESNKELKNCLESFLQETSEFLNHFQGIRSEVMGLVRRRTSFEQSSEYQDQGLTILNQQLQILIQSLSVTNEASGNVAQLSSTLSHQSKALGEGVESFVKTIRPISLGDRAA